jgi:predicted secreted protein
VINVVAEKKFLIAWKDESYGRYAQIIAVAKKNSTLLKHADEVRSWAWKPKLAIVKASNGWRAKGIVKYSMYLADNSDNEEIRELFRKANERCVEVIQ